MGVQGAYTLFQSCGETKISSRSRIPVQPLEVRRAVLRAGDPRILRQLFQPHCIDTVIRNKPRHESLSQQLNKLEDVMLISHDCESTDTSVTASSTSPSINYHQFSAEQMTLILRLESFVPTDYQMPLYFGGGPQDEEKTFNKELKQFEKQRKIKHKKLTSTICNKPVNLFKLYYLVKNRGGFESVSNEKKWTEVASECCSLVDQSTDLGRRCREVYEERLLEFDRFISARKHEIEKSVELAAQSKDLFLPAAIVGVAHQLNAEAIDTLSPGQELEGSAIIGYLNFQKTTVQKKVHVFDPFFFDFLANEGTSDKTRSFIQDLNIFDFELLLFVIHISANKEKKGGHWVLAAADSRNHSLSYYDSMAGGWVNDGDYPDVEGETRMEKIRQFLIGEHTRLQRPGRPANWLIQPVGDTSNYSAVNGTIPQQNNIWDCGVFVCEFGKCLIRDEKFIFEQSDILLREQIKAVLQSLVNETAPRKPEMEPERTEGMEGGPKEQLNAAQSEDQEIRVNDSLKKFIRYFVEKFEKKMKEYWDELELGGKTKKAGKIADTLATGVSGVAALFPIAAVIKPAAQLLSTKGPISLGSYDHREKAKRCIAAITSPQENGDTTRKIRAEAGFDIFQSFEEQFSELTDTDGIWGREIEKLAQDAVDRVINYVYKNAVQCLDTSALISKAVIMGESKESLTALVSLSKPGRTVKSKQSGKTVKSSEIYSKTGLVMIKDNVPVHYSKKNDGNEEFGFRLALEWESEERDEEFLKKYEICERPSGDVYKYIINSENREQIVSAVLKEIDDKDPSKRLKRIEEGVATSNQSVEGLKEQLTAISDHLKTLRKKNKDEGSFFFNVTDPVESFTGRRVELERLHDLMQQSPKNDKVTSRIVSISGLGGVGKTQLVRQYIDEQTMNIHCQYYDNYILWMDADNYETLTDSFIKLAGDERVGISTKDRNGIEKDIRTVVDEVYRHFADRKSLFIFDNAEKYSMKQDDDPSKNRGIVTFLPTSLKGYAHKPDFIITSRNQNWPGKKNLPLHEFSEDDAREFIKNALERDESNSQMDELAETLQRFPLALQQAVAYIRVTNDNMNMMGGTFDIEDYLRRYQEGTKELLDFEFPEDSDNKYLHTTLTTWKITTDKMRDDSENGLALNILDIIAYIAPDNIPAEMFSGLNNDKEQLGDALRRLVQYSMVQCRGEQSTLNVHRLVQQVTRLKLSQEMRNEEIIVTTFQLLQKFCPSNSDNVENIAIMQKLLPHIEVILTHMDDWSAKKPENEMMIKMNFILEILKLLYEGCKVMSNPTRGKDVLLRQLAIEQKYLGPDHFNVAVTLQNLGIVYGLLGFPGRMNESIERTLPILESHFGSKHTVVAGTMGNLMSAFGSLGDREKQRELLERALPILESHCCSEHYEDAPTTQNLGIIYGLLGDHEKGKELMERALLILEKHFGPDHFQVAWMMVNLGNAYGLLGDHERERELMERALPILERYFGPDHFKVARIMVQLGDAYGSLGDHEKEKELLKRALPILERHFGPDHFEVALTLINLGLVHILLEDAEQVKVLMERALPILVSHYGPDHFQVAEILESLGNAYGSSGNHEKKKELIERALPILERHFGPDHFEVARTLTNLGVAHGLLGDAEKVKVLMERALPIMEIHYGPDHFKVAEILKTLGIAYGSLGDHEKQKELTERALPILESHYGPGHIQVAEIFKSLGIAYGSLEDAEKAKEFMERALPILEIHYGPEHFQVAEILESLGNAYGSLGDYEKQKELTERALPILESHYGSEHYEVAGTMQNLGLAHGSLGDAEKAKELMERALPILERHFGPDHIDVAQTLINLGLVHRLLGDAEKAKVLMERALPILVSHYGPDHFRVAEILESLGNAYGSLRDAEKAKVLMERALPILVSHYGPDHIRVAEILKNLGNTYGSLGDHEKRRELMERALSIEERHYGSGHFEIARTLIILGSACRSSGDLERQKECFERSLAIQEGHNEFEDRKLLPVTLMSLGFVCGELEYYHEAYEMYERSSKLIDMQTSLHLAATESNLKTVEYILERGADILARNNHHTVLHSAVCNSHTDVIRLILDKILNKYPHNIAQHVNAKDADGDTPLMWAAEAGKVEAAKLLLEYGADQNIQNNDNMTALNWAEKEGHHEIVQLLLNHNADHNVEDEDEQNLVGGG